MHGSTVCYHHGGAAPQARRIAAQRVAEAEAARAVSRWGGPPDVTPAEALLHLVGTKAAEVAYWQQQVDQLDHAALTWGLDSTVQGVGPDGPVDQKTERAAPDVALTLLHKTQDQLASYSTAALKAGVDERMVRMAESQGAVMVRVIDSAVASILQAAGVTLPADIIQQAITAAIDQEAA